MTLILPWNESLHQTRHATLLREVRAQQAADNARRATRLAVRLARGRVGRTLVMRDKPDPTWADRRVFSRLHRLVARFTLLRNEATQTRRAGYGEPWELAVARAQTVEEAWSLVAHRWLAPAWQRGVWYEEPFTALRLFLDSCADAGLTRESERLPGDDIGINLTDAEHELARRLVGQVASSAHPGRWEDHPSAVDLPRWRESLAHGVRQASVVAGRPVPASITELIAVATHAEVALAAALAPNEMPTPNDQQPDQSTIDDLLACASAVALVDSGRVLVTWEWPDGTTLRSQGGQMLDPEPAAADRTDLPGWLKEQGVDPDAPLWLGWGDATSDEEPLYAFNARVDGSRRRVVISNKGVYVFDNAVPLLSGLGRLLRPDDDPGTWDPGWAAVASGEIPEDVLSISWNEVANAQLIPTLRDTQGWRLRLRTPNGAVVIREGSGIGRLEALIGSLVDNRLRRVGPPRLKGFRWDFLRLTAVCLGGLTSLFGGVLLFHPEVTASRFVGCMILAVGLAVATLPLSLRMLRVWQSERQIRRETQPVSFWENEPPPTG